MTPRDRLFEFISKTQQGRLTSASRREMAADGPSIAGDMQWNGYRGHAGHVVNRCVSGQLAQCVVSIRRGPLPARGCLVQRDLMESSGRAPHRTD